jgi:hypothetical protein
MTVYQKCIVQIALRLGRKVDPRHIEAFMRLEHPTLNSLSPEHAGA